MFGPHLYVSYHLLVQNVVTFCISRYCNIIQYIRTVANAGIGQLKSFLDTEPTKFLEEKLGLYLSMKNIRSHLVESLTD